MERFTFARRRSPAAVLMAVGLAAVVTVGQRSGDPGPRALRSLPLAASGGARAAGESAPRDAASSYGAEVVIPERLLAGLPTEGAAYDLTPADTARIAALARALGVEGDVRADGDGWVAGSGDRVLRVWAHPGWHWSYGPDKGGGTAVGVAEPDKPVSNDASPNASAEPCAPDATVCPVPAPCPTPPPGAEPACNGPYPEPTKPPLPTEDEARAVAGRVFAGAGLANPAVTVHDAWSGLEVVAAPVVDGLPTVGYETRVTVADGGTVLYANGVLGGATLADRYPLLAPRAAVDRGGAWGYGARDIAVGAPCLSPGPGPCPTPKPREVRGLRLGLVFLASYDGQRAFLAPAWLLTFEDPAYAEPVLALPDEYLEQPPPPDDKPGEPPSSGSVDPGTDPGTVDPPPPVAGATGDAGNGTGTGGGSTGSTGSGGTAVATPADASVSPS